MYIARYSYFTANIAQVEKENKYMLLISELKSNDYHDFPSLSQDRLFLCLEKAQKLLRRENYALHSFSDGGLTAENWRNRMFYTYILRSLSHPEQRYIGSTSDLKSRLAKHNAGEVPHTSKFKPWKVEAYFAFGTKEKAAAFEAYLKTHSGRSFSNRHF